MRKRGKRKSEKSSITSLLNTMNNIYLFEIVYSKKPENTIQQQKQQWNNVNETNIVTVCVIYCILYMVVW